MPALQVSLKYRRPGLEDTELNDFTKLTVDKGESIKNNKLNITLKNDPVDVLSDGTIRHKYVDNNLDNVFSVIRTDKGQTITEEYIDLYAVYDETSLTSDIEIPENFLFGGIINSCKLDAKNNSHSIELKCADRNNVLMNRTAIPSAISIDDAENAPTQIKTQVRNAASGIPFTAEGFDTNGNLATGNPFYVDARLFSEGILSSGTTTTGSTGRTLKDSLATFQTDGVARGDMVKNEDNYKVAFVVEVVSQTELIISKPIMDNDSGDGYKVSDALIQDWRPDGTSFPSIAYSQNNKPVPDVIGELSEIDSLNTFAEQSSAGLVVKQPARWYVNSDRRVVWFIIDDVASLVMKVGVKTLLTGDLTGHIIYNHSLENNQEGNTNFIVYKAGEDMNGKMIRGFKRSPYSGSVEKKDAQRHWLQIAQDMKIQDARAGNITFVEGTDFNYSSTYNPMDGGDTYPAWDEVRDSIPLSDSDYNDLFKRQAKLNADRLSNKIFAKQALPLWKGPIQIRGENREVGELLDFTDTRFGIVNKKLRNKQVTHTIQKSGWTTSLRTEQDEPEQNIIV